MAGFYGKDRSVSAALTDADKVRLQEIRAEALKNNSGKADAAQAPEPSPTASLPALPAEPPANGEFPSRPRDLPPP